MRLLDHPNLLKLIDVCESARHFSMITEYAAGGELAKYLSEMGTLSPPHAMSLFRQLIYAVEYLHIHCICHGSLRLETILLDEFNNIRIADFGSARWMRSNFPSATSASPFYAAPEVIKGIPYDGRTSDVWSCGVILYALLSGRLPFDDPSGLAVCAKVKSGRYIMPESFPAPFQDVISRLLCPDPHARISIPELKAHPTFSGDFPIGYSLPAPIPLPVLDSPVEPEAGILNLLKHIGYESEDAARAELEAPGHTMAKVFWAMSKRNKNLESLPWPSRQAAVSLAPMDAIDMPPVPAFEVSGRDELDYEPSISDACSFARKVSWIASVAGEEEADEVDCFESLRCDLVRLMAGIQKVLDDVGYEFFHPDPFQILARKAEDRAYLIVRAAYASDETLSVRIRRPMQSRQDFALMSEIERLIVDSSTGVANDP
jgi:BR serine/threonine kinase